MTSIARPSRRVRESATAMRYCGLRIFPSRVSLIFTAMVKQFLLRMSRCNSAIRAGCPDPVLPRACDRRTSTAKTKRWVARRTAAYCARAGPDVRNSVRLRLLQNFLEALGLHPAGHPPPVGGTDEVVVVPQAAEHHLFLRAAEDHRVETDGS